VKHYLHLVDYVIWAMVIVAQMALFVEAIRRHIAADLPRFLIYLGLLSLESLVLVFISTFLSYEAYFYTYYSGTVVETLVLLFVVYEIFLKVFEPLRALPARTVARIICCVLTIIALAIATVISSAHQELGGIWSAVQKFRIAVEIVVCFSFWLLVIYAWLLNLAWWSRVTHVVTGFLVYLNGQALLYVTMWFVPEPYHAFMARLKGVIYLAGLGFWFVAVRTKQVSFSPASLEDLRLLKDYLRNLRLIALRLRNIPIPENPHEQ
jgi:hypothetical protein